MFHCTLPGGKAVALCADRQGEQIGGLEYRYGRPATVELSYPATAANGRRFSASVAPLTPRASVRQVWFSRGGYTYLLSQCVGGDCPAAAGLAVLQGDRLLSSLHCQRSVDDRAWFAPGLAQFGGDAASSRSSTPLLVFDDVDNGIERLYPPR